MTVRSSIDPARLLEEQLAQASPDLLRELLQTFVNTLLSAEADAVCGAEYGTSSPDRVNRRNGYRHRDFDTRAGTVDVAVPKLRQGSYFPEWLLELYLPFEGLVFFGDAGNGDQFAVSQRANREDYVWDHEDDSRNWVAPSVMRYLEWWMKGVITV